MENFADSYAKLNPEQKKAVDHIDGPLLVVAGPGTGKTQLLSLRAAQIIKSTDTDPANILCLTYTNKAAINMKERLLSLIGSEANAITVKTFHSFANQIIDSYPEYFWNGASLRTIPDTRKLEIIEDLLSSLPLDNPLAMKFAGKYTQVKTVIDAIDLSKEAGLTPEKLRSIIRLNIAYIDEIEQELASILEARLTEKQIPLVIEKIDNLKVMNIGESIAPLRPLDEVLKESFHHALNQKLAGKKNALSSWKSKWLQTIDGAKSMHNERKHNNWWLNFCDVYQSYQDASKQLGFMDISDLIIETILAIENHADLRAEVQERFNYVMIDEFQDTNLAQSKLSNLIAEHYASEGRPNIMAVGDDDQTIYRFQGAELNNMREFVNMYSADVIVLTQNYRSTQEVLDVSKKVIEKASSRLVTLMDGLDKNLKSVAKDRGEISYRTYHTKNQQYAEIANLVLEYAEKGNVAVLARYNKSLESLAPFLKEKSSAISFDQQSDLFDDDIVKLILQVIGTISAIYDGDTQSADVMISQLIRHEVWGIEPVEIWELAINNRRSGRWLDSLLDSRNSRLSSIGHWLLWLSTLAGKEPAIVTLDYILGLKRGDHIQSPIIDYIKQKDILLNSLSAVNKFISLVFEYGGGRATIKDFYNMTVRLSNNNISVRNDITFRGDEAKIHLMSVHKSKGLEFDSVIIIDATEDNWSPGSNRSKRTPPSNLPLRKIGDDIDDYARSLYVAMTRARKNVIVTNYTHDENNKEQLASSLLVGVMDQQISELPEADEIVNQLITKMSWPRLAPENEFELLRDRIDEYHLSATDLTTFLNVIEGGPINFLESRLLGLPSPQIPALNFGTAMHEAMEVGQKNAKKGVFDTSLVLTAFEEALRNEPLSATEYDRYLKHGNDLVQRLYKDYNFEFDINALPEEKITAITKDGVRLTGLIDVLHQDKSHVWFDDYKTGKPLRSLDPKYVTDAEKKWRTRCQIIFYYVLLSNSRYIKDKTITKANIIYLEAEHKKELTLSYEPSIDEINNINQLLPIVWKHIKDLNFPDTSKYSQDFKGIQEFCDDLLAGAI